MSPICGLRTRASLTASALAILPSRGGSGSSISGVAGFGALATRGAAWVESMSAAVGLVPPMRVRLRLRPPRRPRRRFFGPPGTWAPFCSSPDVAPFGCSGTEAPALISLMLLARFLTWIAHPRRRRCPPHALSSRSSATGHRFPCCPNRYRVYDLWRGPMPFLALRISPCPWRNSAFFAVFTVALIANGAYERSGQGQAGRPWTPGGTLHRR